MEDFVVKRLDGTTFKSLYFRNGKWTSTSEKASKLNWSQAEYIKNWHIALDDGAFYELVLCKDASIKKMTSTLQTL